MYEYILYGGISLYVLFVIINILSIPLDNGCHSRWDFFNEDFSFSSIKFYECLEKELQKNETSRIRFEEIKLKEGNFFSSDRIYLRIYWRDLYFDVCAAPFGNSFFISWWLLYRLTIEEKIVYIFLGGRGHRNLFPVTYYRVDSATAFMKLVHTSALNIVDDLTLTAGARFMDKEERKPILNDFFNR